MRKQIMMADLWLPPHPRITDPASQRVLAEWNFQRKIERLPDL